MRAFVRLSIFPKETADIPFHTHTHRTYGLNIDDSNFLCDHKTICKHAMLSPFLVISRLSMPIKNTRHYCAGTECKWKKIISSTGNDIYCIYDSAYNAQTHTQCKQTHGRSLVGEWLCNTPAVCFQYTQFLSITQILQCTCSRTRAV